MKDKEYIAGIRKSLEELVALGGLKGDEGIRAYTSKLRELGAQVESQFLIEHASILERTLGINPRSAEPERVYWVGPGSFAKDRGAYPLNRISVNLLQAHRDQGILRRWSNKRGSYEYALTPPQIQKLCLKEKNLDETSLRQLSEATLDEEQKSSDQTQDSPWYRVNLATFKNVQGVYHHLHIRRNLMKAVEENKAIVQESEITTDYLVPAELIQELCFKDPAQTMVVDEKQKLYAARVSALQEKDRKSIGLSLFNAYRRKEIPMLKSGSEKIYLLTEEQWEKYIPQEKEKAASLPTPESDQTEKTEVNQEQPKIIGANGSKPVSQVPRNTLKKVLEKKLKKTRQYQDDRSFNSKNRKKNRKDDWAEVSEFQRTMRKHPLLTKEQEYHLGEQMAEARAQFRETMFESDYTLCVLIDRLDYHLIHASHNRNSLQTIIERKNADEKDDQQKEATFRERVQEALKQLRKAYEENGVAYALMKETSDPAEKEAFLAEIRQRRITAKSVVDELGLTRETVIRMATRVYLHAKSIISKHEVLSADVAERDTLENLVRMPLEDFLESAQCLIVQYGNYKEARDSIINSNSRLAISIARTYQGRGFRLIDLVMEGMVGVMKAAELFDHRLGYRFSTLATPAINHRIERALREGGSLIAGHGLADALKQIREETKKLQKILKREPSEEEVCEQLKYDVTRYREIMAMTRAPVSLERGSNGGDDDFSLLSQLSDQSTVKPEVQAHRRLLKEGVREALAKLSYRERQIVNLRFGIGVDTEYTLEEVGTFFGITRERVRQIETKALEKLKAQKELQAHKE